MSWNIKWPRLINHPWSPGVILFMSWTFASRGGELVLMSWPQRSKVKLSSSWVVSTAGPLCLGRQLEIELSVCVFVRERVTEKVTLFMCMCAYVWISVKVCVCAHAEVRVTRTKCTTCIDPWGQCDSINPVKCSSDLPPHPLHSQTKPSEWKSITPQ